MRGGAGCHISKDTLPVFSSDPEIIDEVHDPVAFQVLRVAVPHLRA